eukprot:TRINITY_DN1836_c1_g1_i1.p1 TRINITY_DN1836_c1_g1~~TRINITY_DN1836_c1_g1_i1.p1  ORF type:complete len:730 (+),score=233.37 TRINITY_DN1836_c1_g1_i1:85-2274(+)
MRRLQLVAVVTACCSLGVVLGDRKEDWLVEMVKDPAYVRGTTGGGLVIGNGLVTRRFVTTPAFGTVDVSLNATSKYGGEQSLFRSVHPEGSVWLDGKEYMIGGLQQVDGFLAYCNRSGLALKADSGAFRYVNHSVSTPAAPFPWTPGTRHSSTVYSWPPKGVTLSVVFHPPPGAPQVEVTLHYQVLQGIPLLEKWMTIRSLGDTTQVQAAAVEFLGVMPRWGKYFTHGSFVPGADGEGAVQAGTPNSLLHAKTDQAHSSACTWEDDYPNSVDNIPGCASCKDEGAVEPYLNCSYTRGPGAVVSPTETFASFKAFLLVTDSEELERHTLSRHRVTQMLAPHTTENPIFFHCTHSDPTGFKKAVDQMAEVGFEMFIFSFGSGFNLESTNPSYLAEVKSLVQYANAKGIEVGGYDLICLDRGGSVPKEYQAVGNTGDACFASGWYDDLFGKAKGFLNSTGLSMLETDGPYGGETCGSTSHAHHHNLDDSVYKQTVLQNTFYQEMRRLGVYVNQPDDYFFQGGSRTGMGYDEQQYSLPRWRDLSVSRMGLYDDLYVHLPTQGWMFLPITQYHAGGTAAEFQAHQLEYEWGLAQYLGAGTAACYRGDVPYTTDSMKAVLQKWIGMYKAHRQTLIQPVVHIRRPSMQSWDAFLHVNPYSATAEVGLAMVFNPTDSSLTANVNVPLYYTGLTTTTLVSIDGQSPPTSFTLNRDYSVDIPVSMPPLSVHYVVFSKPN